MTGRYTKFMVVNNGTWELLYLELEGEVKKWLTDYEKTVWDQFTNPESRGDVFEILCAYLFWQQEYTPLMYLCSCTFMINLIWDHGLNIAKTYFSILNFTFVVLT